MKAIIIFALVAIACCNEYPIEQDLEANPIDVVKCFVENALPLIPQITEIIAAIKEKDFLTAALIGMGMYEDIKEMIATCLPKEENLALDIGSLLDCLGSIGGCGFQIAQIVAQVKAGNIPGAIAIGISVLSSGGVIFEKCGKLL